MPKGKLSSRHQSYLEELTKVVSVLLALPELRRLVPGPISGKRKGSSASQPRLKISDEGSHIKLIASAAGVQVLRVYFSEPVSVVDLQKLFQKNWRGEVTIRNL